jgi:hypothetical protein
MASDATTEQAGETVAEIRWLSKIRSFVDEHFCWDKTGEPVDEAVKHCAATMQRVRHRHYRIHRMKSVKGDRQ